MCIGNLKLAHVESSLQIIASADSTASDYNKNINNQLATNYKYFLTKFLSESLGFYEI